MPGLDKKSLSERDICTKFITPAVKQAGWDEMSQIREEVGFTRGRIIVRGKLVTRGKAKRADYILYYKPNIPIALIEAKDNNHSIGDGYPVSNRRRYVNGRGGDMMRCSWLIGLRPYMQIVSGYLRKRWTLHRQLQKHCGHLVSR